MASPTSNSFLDRVFLLLAALILAGCVSPKEHDLRIREARYRATLSTLKSGSTRADLCRLLPPIAPAGRHDADLVIAHSPRNGQFELDHVRLAQIVRGTFAIPRARNLGWELHRAAPDFFVTVGYEYQKYRQLRPFPRTRKATVSNSRNEIDALLFGVGAVGELLRPRFRVYPNSHDRIVTVPLLIERTTKLSNGPFRSAYDPMAVGKRSIR